MNKIILAAVIVLVCNCANAQPTAGLVAYWPMDGNFTDLGPYGINGTNVGATATTNSAGTANKAMLFLSPSTTVSQYATHPVNANLNFGTSQDFTITFKVFANSPFVHTGGFYDNNLNYSGPGVWFWNTSGFPQVQFNFKNASVGTTNGAFPVGVWKSVCCMRQGAVMKIYINGLVNATTPTGSSTPAYSYPARFGTMFYSGYTPAEYNGLNGKIDEVRIYNRALTDLEVLLVLPFKLSSFSAVKNNADVLLHWQTAYEQGIDHFNVQRSTDGINFNNIAAVQARGGATTSTDYQFTDNTLQSAGTANNIFYRLETVDINSRNEISTIVNVKMDIEQKELQLLENPVVNDLHLQFYSATKEKAGVIVYDASGRQLIMKEIQVNPGVVFTTIPLFMLQAGTYYVSVVSSQGKQIKTFIRP